MFCRPGGHRNEAVRAHGPGHLGHGSCAVGEELKTLLAEHNVEGAIGDVERRRRALEVLDRSGTGLDWSCRRGGEHGGADVTGHDASCGADRAGRQPRDGAQVACDIQH